MGGFKTGPRSTIGATFTDGQILGCMRTPLGLNISAMLTQTLLNELHQPTRFTPMGMNAKL